MSVCEITYHSPLVMASIEPKFDENRDRIFHLDLVPSGLFEGQVVLEKPDFVRYGSVNSWLTKMFNVRYPYSIEAEHTMEKAKKLQLKEHVTQEEVQEMSEYLQKYLPDHDPFWLRWLLFAEKYGVEL